MTYWNTSLSRSTSSAPALRATDRSRYSCVGTITAPSRLALLQIPILSLLLTLIAKTLTDVLENCQYAQ